MLLHESNLAAWQPRRAPHQAIEEITSKGLAKDPYRANRVGREPATLRTQGTELTTGSRDPFFSQFLEDLLSPVSLSLEV